MEDHDVIPLRIASHTCRVPEKMLSPLQGASKGTIEGKHKHEKPNGSYTCTRTLQLTSPSSVKNLAVRRRMECVVSRTLEAQ